MKKKVFAFLLVLVMASSLIYGCGLIQRSNERDYAQVIATVGDDDYKDEITKKDLVTLYINQGSSYMQNYNLTAGQTMEILLQQLINNRILIQKGVTVLKEIKSLTGSMEYYLSKEAIDGKKKSERLKELVGDESFAIAQSNMYKYENDTINSYEEAVKEDWATATPTDAAATPTASPTVTPRPTRIPDVIPTPTLQAEPDRSPTEETRIEAYKRFKEDLEEQKKTFDEFLEDTLCSYLESEILSQYQKHLYTGIRVSEEDLRQRLEQMTLSQDQQYDTDLTSYITQLKGAAQETFLLCNPLNGYGYVKNLLIGFDEDLAAELAQAQNMEWSRTQYLAVRDALLAQVKVKDLRDNIDAEQKKPDKTVPELYDEIYAALGGTPNSDVYGNGSYTKTVYQGVSLDDIVSEDQTKLDYFIDLIFTYGTDPGMFNNAMDYLSAPRPDIGGTETYVTEFADAARAVVKAGKGSYTLVGSDFGWHVILCTDKISANSSPNLNITDDPNIIDDYDKIIAAEDYESLTSEVTDTFTYKLYNVMRNEIKEDIYNVTATTVIKDYESKVTKYEDRYKDLISIS